MKNLEKVKFLVKLAAEEKTIENGHNMKYYTNCNLPDITMSINFLDHYGHFMQYIIIRDNIFNFASKRHCFGREMRGQNFSIMQDKCSGQWLANQLTNYWFDK